MYFVIIYIYHFSSIFNHIWTFLSKRTLMSFNFFFSLFKTHIFHLIQVVLIIVTSQKLWFLVVDGTYFFWFNHAGFVHHVVNNSVILLFFLETFPRYGIASAVLSRLGCRILSSKFAQDLTFIRRMSSTMDHTGFLCALQLI